MKTTLLIPTFNEIDGMKNIMPRIKREWVDQIIFVDGHSTDGTIEFIKEHDYTLVLQNKPGVRNAYMEALDIIEGDVVITFSPDGNCIPEIIPVLIEKIKGSPIKPTIANAFNLGGFVVLMGLMLLVTYSDILKFF